jgi:amidase
MPAMHLEPWQMSANEIASAINSRQCSATEVVKSHLRRIAELNPKVNAVTQVLEESALSAALALDRGRDGGKILGPLAGVPFSIKESIDVAGSPTTFGIRLLKDSIPPTDAPIVGRLRKGGAIPIARTNLPDLSMRFHTTSQLYGETRNPWSGACSPGGSSGGEGVALATGMSPMGLGSDAGGSVRIPALFAGVTALKPTFGRLPSDRRIGPRDVTLASQLIPVEGLLARTVEDLRTIFKIVAGPDPSDPRVVPAPLTGAPLEWPIRVAVISDPGDKGVAPAVARAVEHAAHILEQSGYKPEIATVPRLDDALETYGKLIMTEFHQSWPLLQRLLAPDARRYIEFSMAACAPADLAEYLRFTSVYQSVRRDWCEFLSRFPLILAPVFTEVAVPNAYDIAGPAEHERVGRAMRMCVASSLVGVPAVAVQTGFSEGLPLGVQLIGQFYREDTCLEAASIIENYFGAFRPIDPRV